MSLALHYGATINATISSSANPACNCAGAAGVLVHILTTSSLTITGQVALDGGASSPDYSTVPITNFKTGAVTAAGTAITVSQDDLYYVPVNGASKFQLVRGAGSGTVSMQPVFAVAGAGSGSSTGPLGIGKAEDAAHASGDVGVMSLAVRTDAATARAGTDGDYAPIEVDSIGRLHTLTPVFTSIASGELQGSATELQLPDVACKMVRFKACYNNAGRVYIGVDNVTKQDGTTDTTTGLELNAGDDTGWIPASNLNIFWRICDNAGDDLTYLAMVN